MNGHEGMTDLTDANFESFIRNNGLVLVDFWASWCMPCRMQGRILESGMKDMPEGVRIAKVNVDENPQVARRFNVRGIPQMFLFVNGRSVKGWTGVTPAEVLIEEAKRHIMAK